MLCFNSPLTNPYYHLAAEEYLLKNSEDNIFMLWQSDPIVVCGKHQNILSEINYRYVQQKGILIARRLTGGGTVFHDHGNLNFSFIRNGEQGKMVDFSKFLEPVITCLNNRDIPARQGPKHEILVHDLKISGNAEHVFKNRVLHHGTLLINSNLQNLRNSIHHHGGVYTDKAVQSNRASVINLSEYLQKKQSTGEFRNDFFDSMVKILKGKTSMLNPLQNEAVMKLADEKYRNHDWIFGWSPDYTFSNAFKNTGLSLEINLVTHRGKIVQSILKSNEIDGEILQGISKAIMGKLHTEPVVRKALIVSGFEKLVQQDDFENVVYAFF